MNRFNLIPLYILLLSFVVHGQQNGVITGEVINGATFEPVPFANVLVEGTQIGAASDADGNFKITGLAPGIYSVRASAVGYISVTKTDVTVTNNKPVSLEFELLEAAVELDDVTVTSDYFYRAPTDINSIRSFSYEEIRRSPGGFEDVIRALSVLPGVSQVGAGRNDLIVRGGAPSENLYLVDGIEIPNINHFGTQGATGGPQSYINLDFVKETEFSTGAFPVLYGDKLSSVLRIDLRDGREDRIGGKGTIAATQFGLNLEGPISESTNFIFSARRSYLDFIFKAADFAFVPEYYDLLTKVDSDIDKNNKVSFLFLGAFDNVKYFDDTEDQRYDLSQVLGTDQLQYSIGASWRHLIDNGFIRLVLSRDFTDYDAQQRDSLLNPVFTNKSFEAENKLKAEIVYNFMSTSELTAGIEANYINTDFDIKLPTFVTSFGDTLPLNSITSGDTYQKAAAYANWTHVYLNGAFSLNLGVRGDWFSGIENGFYFSPRFSASYVLTDLTNVNFSAGIYHQSPSYIWLSSGLNDGLSAIRVNQYVAGLDHRLREDTQLKVELYYKDYEDYPSSEVRPYLVLANTGAGFAGADDNFSAFGLEPLVSEGYGVARGAELSIQKKLSDSPYYGILSLTFNESRFTALDGLERPGTYDQKWIFNVSGGYRFNEKWDASLRFRYATGAPYTPFNSDGTQSVANYNAGRLPDLHALDVRVDRRWYFETTTLIVYLDIQNIYNRNNITFIRWDKREQKEDRESSIGVLPSIGVSLEF